MRRPARPLFAVCSAAPRLLRLNVVLFGLIWLSGCVPVRQYNVTGGQQYDSFGYHDWHKSGLLQIGPSNVPKRVTVVDSASYAIAPNSARYGIETEPHGYDLDEPDGVSYVRDRVYLVRANGRRSKRSWANGRWTFLFVLDTPDGRDARQFTVDLRTFNYNPVVHGPPN